MESRLRTRLQQIPRRWLLAIAFTLGVALLSAAVLWHLRANALQAQARELTLLSLALADEADRGLQGAQQGLQALRAELQDGRLPLAGAARALQTRAALMPLVAQLWLVDTQGRVLSASQAGPAPGPATFRPALDGLRADSIAVGSPFADPVTHEPMIAIATGFRQTPQGVAGWILAAIPARALLGAFSVASPALDARMAVFRDDGIRLTGAIVQPPRLPPAALAQRLAGRQGVNALRFGDGSERLVAVHDLPRFGLQVVLTRSIDAALAGWRQTAQLTGAGIALLLLVVAVAVRRVRRADRHRDEAQRALQQQRSRASKLEALGTLAGGVAHDFNNVLAAIVGFGEMAHDAAAPGSEQWRQIDRVLQAALRGKSLVERILAFSRGGARTSTVFELEPIVQEVLALLAASLRPGIVLERALDTDGARLRGDPTQVFEAVMNLCTNAMQAMPRGGRLSVRLERAVVDRPRVLSHSRLEPGHYLRLAVQDQGTGMTAGVMERLFEPFFTTREAQAGTGLGLAVVHGVIAEAGGAIDVQSAPGQGACFALYFPESRDPLARTPAAPDAAAAGAGQRLLVVDDDPALVALTSAMLGALGYRPTGCTEPAAALQALREGGERYAALITDEVMPQMTGTQLTRLVRLVHPELPVLLVSGYGGAALALRAAQAGVTRLLAKPLQRAELGHALDELLRRR
ncbi:ATP-binding protein [Caenimonas terrae]|uniref:histidine kinase n=1 Tax=Caenimonas terrae TaxID=696074 RepID=A0ABW0NFV6_9BURK